MTSVDRRTVLKGAAAGCGAGVLAACGSDDDPDATGETGGGSTASGSTGPDSTGGDAGRVSLVRLDQVPVGGAVSASSPDGDKLLVVRPSEDEAVAFSAICPHQGCTVAPGDGQLSCPCHGSAFELDGSVRRGPAESGLRPYQVRVVDGQVLPA